MPKEEIYRKHEMRGRISFIILTLIPVVAVFIIDFDMLKNKILCFVLITVFAIVANQIMSKVLRKRHPIITEEKINTLMDDRNFGPAITSRIITFSVSIFGSITLSLLMRPTEILPPIMFFLIGYVYFTMIQFRRL